MSNDIFTDDTLVVNGRLIKNRIASSKDNIIYFKSFDLNELIGSELGSIRKLNVNKNFIFQLSKDKIGMYKIDKSKKFYIGSYDFKNKDYLYSTIKDYYLNYPESNFDTLLRYCSSSENRLDLTYEMLELIGLDIFMGQEDRYFYNLMFERRKDGSLHLAPIYDFSFSFGKSGDINNIFSYDNLYDSCLLKISDLSELKEIINKYPYFKEILKSYIDVKIDDYIDLVVYKYKLNKDYIDYNEYINYCNNRKKILKKIIKR